MSARPLLFIALSFTLGASVWLARSPQDEREALVVAVQRSPGRGVPRAPARTPVADNEAHRPVAIEWRASPWPEPVAEALAAWNPPPPAAQARTAAAAAPPAAPRPPAFPYQWIGRLDDGDAPQALLNGQNRSFGVRAGDVLEARWRVDSVASNGLQVTWLPTGDVVHVAVR